MIRNHYFHLCLLLVVSLTACAPPRSNGGPGGQHSSGDQGEQPVNASNESGNDIEGVATPEAVEADLADAAIIPVDEDTLNLVVKPLARSWGVDTADDPQLQYDSNQVDPN